MRGREKGEREMKTRRIPGERSHRVGR